MEYVLVVVKPDGMQRNLAGLALSRFTASGLQVIAAKALTPNRSLVEEHYQQLRDKPFYPEMIDFFSGKKHDCGKLLAFVLGGKDAVRIARDTAGSTDPEKADPHSIRGSFGRITTSGLFENVVHVSSDRDEARREIRLWFSPDDIQAKIFPVKQSKNKACYEWV